MEESKKVDNKHMILATINDLYCEMRVSNEHDINYVKGFHAACDLIYTIILTRGEVLNK